MRLLNALRLKNQASPSNPASGDTTLFATTDTVPRLKTRSSGGTERYLPYMYQYNVKDYGAVGDGTTDDAAAIQAAMDAANTAGGGTVYIPQPSSYYKINSELEFKGPGIRILCDPTATIKRGSSGMQYMIKNFNSSYAPTLYAGRGDLVIEGGIWDADGANISAACTVIIFAHATNIRVSSVTVQNVPDWHGVEFNSCLNAICENSLFRGYRVVTAGREMSEAVQIDLAVSSGALPGIGAGAIDNTPCYDVLMHGCTVMGFGTLGSFGKLVGTHSATNTFEQENIRVVNNYAEDLNDYGVAAFNWNNAVIANNQFINCNGGVLIEIPTGCTTDIERFVVTGNQFIGSGTQNNGTAIITNLIETRLTGTGVMRSVTINNNQIKNYANTTAIKIQTSSDVMCHGNQIRNGTNAASEAIHVNNSALGTYVGNKIDSVLGTAMIFENASTECTIQGNVLSMAANGIQIASIRCVLVGNMLRVSSLSKYGFQLTTSADETIISSNLIRMTVGSPTQAGIDIDGAMDVVIQNNWIKGWGTTEGSTGPINRGGTLNPNISTTPGTTNNNAYQ